MNRTAMAVLFSLGTHTLAQEAPAPESPTDQGKPKTRLEAFAAQDGTVMIRGYSRVGEVKGSVGTSVAVESKEFLNPGSGKKEHGLTIEVRETTRLNRSQTSYVDFDEIASLLKGIDYISRVEKGVTSLDEFEADYRTRGGLRIAVYSTSAMGIRAAVSSGSIGKTTAFVSVEDLGRLRALVQSASETLGKLRAP